MIYVFAGDDTRYILYDEVKDSFNVKKSIFDGSNEEEFKQFKEALSLNNLFQEKGLLILKNGKKIKKIYEFINSLKSTKEIIIDLEDDGKIVDKLMKNENIKIIFSLDDKNNSKKVSYISKNLNIDSYKAKEILDMIDKSFYNIKNEVDKIKLLNDTSYEDIKSFLYKNYESDLISSAENIIDCKRCKNRVEFLPLLYTILTILRLCLKIKLLNIKDRNYSIFYKETYLSFKDILISHPYFVFKNIERSLRLKEDFIEKIIFILLEIEYKSKTGLLNENQAIEFMKLSFLQNL